MSRSTDNQDRINGYERASKDDYNWRQRYTQMSDDNLEFQVNEIYRHMAQGYSDNANSFQMLTDEWDKARANKIRKNTRMEQIANMVNRRLLMTCFEPLANEVSFGSIVETMTVLGFAYMANPRIRGMIQGVNNRRMENKYAQAMNDMQLHPEKYGNKWKQKRIIENYEKYTRATHDGRLPLTPDTAANIKLGLERERFVLERQLKSMNFSPDEYAQRMGEIDNRYRDRLRTLQDIAAADGVSQDQINQSERIMVDRLIRYDEMKNPNQPSQWRYMFNGIAQNKVVKAPPERKHFHYEDENGKMRDEDMYVWNGEYVDPTTGNAYTGGFEARPPYDTESLGNDMADLYTVSCDDAKRFYESGDASKLTDSQAMMYRSVAAALGQPDAVPLSEDLANDPHFKAMAENYKNYMDMAKMDGMNGEQVQAAMGIAASQGMSSWICDQALGDNIGNRHSDIEDIMNAKAFAEASSHLDPNSKEWNEMADQFFDQQYDPGRFESPSPEDVKAAYAPRLESLRADVKNLKRQVALRQQAFEDSEVYVHTAADALKGDKDGKDGQNDDRNDKADKSNDSAKPEVAEKADTKDGTQGKDSKSEVEGKAEGKDDASEASDRTTADKQNTYDASVRANTADAASLREAKKMLAEAEDRLRKEEAEAKESVETAERLWNDKGGYQDAINANKERKNCALNMARIFTQGMRTARQFGADNQMAYNSMTRGIGNCVHSWAQGDENNLTFANTVNYTSKKAAQDFVTKTMQEHPEWMREQPVKPANQQVNDVVEDVNQRYQERSSRYGDKAEARFGFGEDNNYGYGYDDEDEDQSWDNPLDDLR